MSNKNSSKIDRGISEIDKVFRILSGYTSQAKRKSPAFDIPEGALSHAQRKQAMRLMRVNHAGEVSAQALYHGQALAAHLPKTRAAMENAAIEETEHLAWCAERIEQLEGKTSVLNPLWYSGSFLIGFGAGIAGDKWSLGFVAETENQVVQHLDKHLSKLSDDDIKTKAILEQMKLDEAEHRQTAINAGAATLSKPAALIMSLVSKIMTTASYRI